MLPDLPCLEYYDVSPRTGFLPEQPPLEVLPDVYYVKWEAVVRHLQPLLLSKRIREVIEDLPVITTSRLRGAAEWRRAYLLLSFMAHAYIWGGDKPEERVPPPIAIPYIQVCGHLELPPVATYSGLVLWNWKPIFEDEPMDNLSNLATLSTFTGSLDESWFYLISVAMEARGAPIIPLMLQAIAAARENNVYIVTECLQVLAERLDELGTLLQRMYENNDPHVFYHRIRPFLSGSKNMADAGLPNGVIFDTGSVHDRYVQYGGGSNAQSSLIQVFDIVLGVEHRPTGIKPHKSPAANGTRTAEQAPPTQNNFIHDMRNYMPGPHRRFLTHLTSVANIRPFVDANRNDRSLVVAYDAALAMLRALRDKHMQMVSRYIVIKSHESRSHERALSPTRAPPVSTTKTPSAHSISPEKRRLLSDTGGKPERPNMDRKLTGTGGTSLIPFLKQARDETGEAAVGDWFNRTLRGGKSWGAATPSGWGSVASSRASSVAGSSFESGTGTPCVANENGGEVHVVGLSGVWRMDDCEGGICHW